MMSGSNFRHWSGLVTILLLLTLALAACSTPGGRNPEQVCDDTVIASSIKARLTEMMGLAVIGIDVDVFQGEVVLQGRVLTPNQESRVVAVAARTPGVKKVVNLLKVVP
jgi:osmotically-inducible protein OsmY